MVTREITDYSIVLIYATYNHFKTQRKVNYRYLYFSDSKWQIVDGRNYFA